ncbi:MAG: hypothetical protein ABEJ72_04680 [Candidatus Aenigmatarchaeota archaeon]
MDKDKIFAIFISLLFIFSVMAYAVNFAFPDQRSRVKGGAYLQIYTCGERRDIPSVNESFDGSYIRTRGTGNLVFSSEGGVTLGQVFDAMNITFSRTELMSYENGDGCNDPLRNTVHVMVGGQNERLKEINQYRSYRVKNGDVIRVRYD